MAKERIFRTICDRCNGVFEEKETNVSSDVEAPAPKVYLEVNGESVVSYEDLCEKCDDRVNNLIKDLKPLPKKASKKNGKGKGKSKAKKPAEKKDSKKDAPAPTGDKPAG
jgi:hypothetical protein